MNRALPAQRPSRRAEIVRAAIAQFARKGFIDASLSHVAEQANVTVTAVYYHFSSKEELFNEALRTVFEAINLAVSTARSGGGPADRAALDAVIDAFWTWTDNHPDETALVHIHIPGVTRQAALLREEFEELHVRRALAYLPRYSTTSDAATVAATHAAATLAARTLVDVLMAVHPLRLADGPLSQDASAHLQAAMRKISHRIVLMD